MSMFSVTEDSLYMWVVQIIRNRKVSVHNAGMVKKK